MPQVLTHHNGSIVAPIGHYPAPLLAQRSSAVFVENAGMSVT